MSAATAPSPAMPNSRKRRFPYTSVACDECQRRKTKCSGEQPCKSCRGSSIICVYERSTRFRSNDRGPTQNPPPVGDDHTSQSAKAPPGVEGSANSDYYLRLAEKRLTAFATPKNDHDAPRLPGIGPMLIGAGSMEKLINCRKDDWPGGVLAAFETEFWMQVLQMYEEEISLQYPFLDLDELRREVRSVKQEGLGGAAKGRSTKGRGKRRIEDTVVLCLAIMATLKDPDAIDVSNPLVREIFADASVTTQLGSVDKDELSILILTSIYYFLTDREILAWRGIGNVLRLLQELICHGPDGLHSQTSLYPLENIGEKFYWCTYTLDRRWSFGTGLPFAVQDSEIKFRPNIQDDSVSSAYLRNMVSFCGIASEVRTSALNPPQSLATKPESSCDFLNFRIDQWVKNLPACLLFRGVNDKFDPTQESRGEYKLRLILYLRANQMKTVVYRNTMVQTESGSMDNTSTNIVMEIAQDSIRILVGLARETDIYETQQKTFNHFLETALSALLLIVCSSKNIADSSCLQDIQAAMRLVQHLSVHSPITRRLRDKLSGIQGVVGEFQQQQQQPQQQQAKNSPRPATHTEPSAKGQDMHTAAPATEGHDTHTAPALKSQDIRQTGGQITPRSTSKDETADGNSPYENRNWQFDAPSGQSHRFPASQPSQPSQPSVSPIYAVAMSTPGTDIVSTGADVAGQTADAYYRPNMMPAVPNNGLLGFPPSGRPALLPMDGLSRHGQEAIQPANFDASQALDYATGDFRSLRHLELGDIFKDYDYFSF